MAAWVIDELSFCCPKNSSLDEEGYLGLFLTLPDCISWKLRCKVHKNPFCLTWFSLRAKLTKMLSCKLHCSETEQIRWSNREDWGGWWFGRHSSYTASPHHTPRKKTYSSTTEHDTGVNCGPAGCAYTVFCCGNISEQGIILETKSPGVGDGGYTPVNDPITLLFIGENTRGWRGPMLGRKERKGVAWWKVYTYQLLINIHFKTPFL